MVLPAGITSEAEALLDHDVEQKAATRPTKPRKRSDYQKKRARSLLHALSHITPPSRFDRVQRFCFFIAPARSGHSIVAHLLSAHPDVLMCDELHALRYFQQGYSAQRVFSLIRWQDFRFKRLGRGKSGYDYDVPNTAQSEGLKKHPLVIGDAKGGATTRLLLSDPGLIERVRAAVGVPLRVIVQVRHPFDMIATKMRVRGRRLKNVARSMRRLAERLERATDLLDEDEKLFQTHEQLIADPKGQFERLFRFLDVEPIPEVVEACASKIWNAPSRTRKSIDWQNYNKEELIEAMLQTRFFAPYFTEPDDEHDGHIENPEQGPGPAKF